MSTDTPHSLRHVIWIGGSPCSGKSSIADMLATRHGMSVYRCDDAFFEHQSRITQERQPIFHRLSRASCDKLWMRPVRQQVAQEIQLYREEFPLILDDLRALPADRPIVAEGAALLPELIERLNVDQRQMLWMVPTEGFQRDHYGHREWRHAVLRECHDPDQAWENWMQRDAGFARNVAGHATERHLCLMIVDGSRSLDATISDIERHLKLR
jgi:2-phosphoglycerate kinase